MQTNPQCYRRPVPLNSELHAALTISPSPSGYRFAAEAHTVLLATAEFFDSCRQFPILFAAAPDGAIIPLALLGLQENENLFVDAAGSWTGSYIPAYFRRYPFITTDEVDGRLTVCFDEAFDGFNREGGLPLFENGEPTQKLQEIQTFLRDYLATQQQSARFTATLREAGLLRDVNLQANLPDGRSYALNGLLMVDEQKLVQLPDTEIVKLFRSGDLALIQAHLLSLRTLQQLIERKAAAAPKE